MKSIEARAIISATDKTGSVLDKIAAKFKGIEKTAKTMEGVKIPKWIDNGDFTKKLQDLNVSEKQMNKILRERSRLHDQLWTKENSRPSKLFAPDSQYMKEMGAFQDRTLKHWKNVKRASEEARAAEARYYRSNGMIGTVGSMIGAGGAAYYAGRAGRYAFDASRTANRETTKQRQSGFKPSLTEAITEEAQRQSRNYPTISETEFRAAGREAVLQMGSQELGLRMMPTIGRFMTSGKVLWGEDKIEEQTRKALQVLDARQITDPARADNLLNALIKSSQVEGGPDFKADDLRTALRYGRDMTRGQSDRFITSVLPQLGVDMGYSQAGTGLASMHTALIGGRQKSEADKFQRDAGLRTDKGLVGQDMFQRNVDQWFDEHYIPALQKKGIDVNDASAVSAFNSQFFSNRTAADVAGNLVSGQQQRMKRREQQGLAKGMEDAETIHMRDVGSALEAVSSQLTNVASSAKLAEASIAGLNRAMSLIQEAGKKINEPGGLFDKGMEQFASEQRDWEAVKNFGAKILEWDRSTGITPPWAPKEPPNFRDYPQAEDPMGKDYSRYQAHQPAYWYGLGREGATAAGAARLRRYEEWRKAREVSAPAISQTMTYGTGMGRYADVEKSANVNVQGEVHGQVEQTFHFVVDSSGLVSKVAEMERLSADIAGKLRSIGGNGPGSTGRSSPDAQAP